MLLFRALRMRMRIEALTLTGLGLALVFGLLAAFPGAAKAEGAPQGDPPTDASVSGQAYERFLAAAERLYESVNGGRQAAAQEQLNEIEQQLRSLPMKAIATAEGIRALAHDVAELKRTLAAVRPDEAKWRNGAASLRLAADELAHPDRPLWHRYDTVVQEDINKLAASLGDDAGRLGRLEPAVHQAFGQLSEHYGLVRTAALLRADPWVIERIDTVLRYAGRIYEAQSPKPELVQGTLAPIREAFGELFPDRGAASETVVPPLGAAPPSWGWSAMMGTFIVTILTWAGWRRYKYEEAMGGHAGGARPDEREDAAERWLGSWRRRK
ncbi:sporulation protein YpjB [Cohnella hongkongensis]|uniref:Sporulation protein YpjB n=1 Tax=Cohnella hongkongensis TaxID=178337 RepID=A0ABV9FDG9_9BACL